MLVGPHAHINGATIESDVFLATGVAVFPGASVHAGSEVRVNAVVHVNTVLAAGTTVPIGWIAAGDPAQLFPPVAHEELWPVQRAMDFPGTVFGIARDELTMERVACRYSEHFGRHRDDRVIDCRERDPARPRGVQRAAAWNRCGAFQRWSWRPGDSGDLPSPVELPQRPFQVAHAPNSRHSILSSRLPRPSAESSKLSIAPR